jgi:hypothetical protein
LVSESRICSTTDRGIEVVKDVVILNAIPEVYGRVNIVFHPCFFRISCTLLRSGMG